MQSEVERGGGGYATSLAVVLTTSKAFVYLDITSLRVIQPNRGGNETPMSVAGLGECVRMCGPECSDPTQHPRQNN